jgi:hypothetical protein
MKTGFGWIEIGGVRYEHDVIVHAGGDVTRRKKKASKSMREEYGHTPLSEAELDFLADEKPEVVYIGTGQYGNLPVTRNAGAILTQYNGVVMPTPEILLAIGAEERRFVAILHVTC